MSQLFLDLQQPPSRRRRTGKQAEALGDSHHIDPQRRSWQSPALPPSTLMLTWLGEEVAPLGDIVGEEGTDVLAGSDKQLLRKPESPGAECLWKQGTAKLVASLGFPLQPGGPGRQHFHAVVSLDPGSQHPWEVSSHPHPGCEPGAQRSLSTLLILRLFPQRCSGPGVLLDLGI